MFGSKIISVTDSVVDYQKFGSGKIAISADEVAVKRHIAEVKFTKFPKNLPFLIRYLLLDIHKSKRMILKEQDVITSDNKILINRLIMNLSMIRIDSVCDCDEFRLKVHHNDDSMYDIETGKSYIYVNSRSIEFLKDGKVVNKRFINSMDICSLEYGHHIEFGGIIEEQNSYSTDSIFKYTTTLFPVSTSESSNGKVGYYDGSFKINYIDNVRPEALLKWAFELILGLLDQIEGPNMIGICDGAYSITVPLDRSGVIAHFIDTYITMVTSPDIIKIEKIQIARETRMMFFGITKDQIEVVVAKAFKLIRAELSNLIKDL